MQLPESEQASRNDQFIARVEDPKYRASYKRRVRTMRKNGESEAKIAVWLHTIAQSLFDARIPDLVSLQSRA